jgi:hypothetical protein
MTIGAMTYMIKIGQLTLKGVSKVNIVTSVESLSDTATIELPAYINNKAYDIESKVKRGMAVEIWLGYDGKNTLEFKGFVRTISVNTPCIIECEDEIFMFRKEVKSEVFIKKSVTDILKSVASQIGYPVVSKVDALIYDKMVINKATGYEVLQKIQDQFRILIYMYNGKLYANYMFLERNGVEYLSFQKNIKAANLTFVSKEDVKVIVNIKGIGADNKATKQISVGDKGGEVVNLPDRLNVTDEVALNNIAREEQKRRSYTGFRGDVTIWGKPYVAEAWVVSVKDEDYPGHDGFYFVKGTTVNFSISGFERKLTLAERLA